MSKIRSALDITASSYPRLMHQLNSSNEPPRPEEINTNKLLNQIRLEKREVPNAVKAIIIAVKFINI